ncbi:MAG: hypothetical protein JJT94_10515 [Bernardetiaceae bacterium]|nr:hypothetical protein [Bernardetiaceae bacterium]
MIGVSNYSLAWDDGIEELDYADIFGEDYAKAQKFMQHHEIDFQRLIGERHYKKAMAVVFPEQLRYKILLDFLETQALLQLYVEEGTQGADFSIGYFQMKPSFAENLETYCKSQPRFSYHLITKFQSAEHGDDKQIRRERITRLQKLEWQLIYLSAFIEIAYHRFPFLSDYDTQQSIIFLAAAYNAGIDKTQKQIEAVQKLKIFPYGKIIGNQQYSYVNISRYFYTHYF